MKKRAIITAVLAVSMILMGTMYAAWTDTLNVTTKVTTGDMDVTFVDLGLYAQYDNEYGSEKKTFTGKTAWSIIDGIGASGYVPADFFDDNGSYNTIASQEALDAYNARIAGYNSIEFDAQLVDAKPIDISVGAYAGSGANSSDKIAIEVNSIFPGFAQAFRTDIVNVGTMAAKLGDIKFDVKGKEASKETKNLVGVALLVNAENYSSDPNFDDEYVFGLAKTLKLGDDAIFKLGGVQFIRLSALEGISDKAIQRALAENVLLSSPVDNRMDLYIAVGMDPDTKGEFTTGWSGKLNSRNDDAKSQNDSISFSIDLVWDQYNIPIDVDSQGNILVDANTTQSGHGRP